MKISFKPIPSIAQRSLIVFTLAIIKAYFIPLADYPDISVVEGIAAERIGLYEYPRAADHSYTTDSSSLVSKLIFGGYYEDIGTPLDLLWGLRFAGLVVIVFLICLLVISLNGKSQQSVRFATSVVTAGFVLPSTPYYLEAIHTDVPCSILGFVLSTLMIVSTFNNKVIQASIVGVFTPLVFSILWPENNLYLISFIFLSILIMKFASLHLSKSGLLSSKRSSIFLVGLFVSSLIVISVFSLREVALLKISSSALGGISNTADQVLLYYGHIASKYNLGIRLYNTFTTALFRTPSGVGLNIFTQFLYAALLVKIYRRMVKTKKFFSTDFGLIILTVLFLISVIITLVPGYSNFKYYVWTLPLFLLPFGYSRANLKLFYCITAIAWVEILLFFL